MPSGKDVLFLSDTLFDIDIGIIRYLKNNFLDSEYFIKDVLNRSNLFFISYIMDECTNNILDIVLKDDYKENSESLYNDILNSNYKDIIEMSPMTNMLDVVLALKSAELNSNIIPIVACKDKCEIDKLLKINHNISTLYTPSETDIFNMDLNRYTRIVIRNIRDINKFDKENKVLGKNIIVLSYRYNFELNNNKKLIEKYTDIADINIFESAIPYANFSLPI